MRGWGTKVCFVELERVEVVLSVQFGLGSSSAHDFITPMMRGFLFPARVCGAGGTLEMQGLVSLINAHACLTSLILYSSNSVI
jgi:hypothetical protein